MNKITLIVIFLLNFIFPSLARYAAAEENTQENKVYEWQTQEFPQHTTKNLDIKAVIEDKFFKEEVPNGKKEIYLWQTGKYKKFENQFKDLIEENIKDPLIPTDKDQLFLWQTNAYKKFTRDFKDNIQSTLERHKGLQEIKEIKK